MLKNLFSSLFGQSLYSTSITSVVRGHLPRARPAAGSNEPMPALSSDYPALSTLAAYSGFDAGGGCFDGGSSCSGGGDV